VCSSNLSLFKDDRRVAEGCIELLGHQEGVHGACWLTACGCLRRDDVLHGMNDRIVGTIFSISTMIACGTGIAIPVISSSGITFDHKLQRFNKPREVPVGLVEREHGLILRVRDHAVAQRSVVLADVGVGPVE